MKYTVEELDAAKCEFVEKLKAVESEVFGSESFGSEAVNEYNGDDSFFGYYRHVTAFIGESFVSAKLIHSPNRSGIVYWDDEKGENKDLTLEEFRNIKL